jgi:hypothetical protein
MVAHALYCDAIHVRGSEEEDSSQEICVSKLQITSIHVNILHACEPDYSLLCNCMPVVICILIGHAQCILECRCGICARGFCSLNRLARHQVMRCNHHSMRAITQNFTRCVNVTQ